VTTSDGSGSGHQAQGDADPRPAAVSVITTEHFTLQGARSSTISESTGRASMFLSAISGGLVALGLIATATHVGTAFYVLGLIVLPTLAFVGLVTADRTLQSGIEDLGYARAAHRQRGAGTVGPQNRLAPMLSSSSIANAAAWRLAAGCQRSSFALSFPTRRSEMPRMTSASTVVLRYAAARNPCPSVSTARASLA